MTETATRTVDGHRVTYAVLVKEHQARGENDRAAEYWAAQELERRTRALAAEQDATRFAAKLIEKTELGLFTWDEAYGFLAEISESNAASVAEAAQARAEQALVGFQWEV